MKFLIIQLHQLGDILLTSSLCRAVKEHVKEAEVHFLTSPLGTEIVRNNPYIDHIITLEKGIFPELKTILSIRREKYDVLIDPQRTGRTKKISLFSGVKKRIAFKKKRRQFLLQLPR